MTDELNPFEANDITKADHLDREALAELLRPHIMELLRSDFEKLCALMYRHDVNERLFNQALSLADDESRAIMITELVIDRELAKRAFREKYKKEQASRRIGD
jgi:hypothetical protein